MINFNEKYKEYGDYFNSFLDDYFSKLNDKAPKLVKDAMAYAIKDGGKRIRPVLCFATAEALGLKKEDVIYEALAIEMIHSYSLVHDDLPAMDNDLYRRGRKTTHAVYGAGMATLAGDGLLNFAFETACKALDVEGADPVRVAKALRVLSSKPGIFGMIGGQVADVAWTGQQINLEQLLFIHKLKTSALIECSMMIGAILAGANEEQVAAMERIAGNIGIAFQIQDDILDVTSTTEELGKPVGSDEEQGKVTYVAIKGLEQAKEDVESYTMEAISTLDSLPYENAFLRELLLFLIHRNK